MLLYFAQMIFIAVQVKEPGDLGRNWVSYTQVMSFVFYFYTGMLVGQWLSARPCAPRSAWLDVVLFAALAPCLAGTSGAVIEDSLSGARRYLLHPLVFSQLMKKHTDFAKANPYAFLLIVLALSFVLALLVEHWLERPLRDFGKCRFGRLGRANPLATQSGLLPS